jgi:TonB family protein
MGTLTTEVPASTAGTKRSGTENLESEAIGLDVAVRIHGSQVAAVVLESTEHVEPFEEDTSTMIVFPRGAVVKLRARVRTGHAVVLTHLGTRQTALCRIIQVNSAANVAHYVKLEFIQPAPGFWGVHFPSDNNAPAAKPIEHAPIGKDIEKSEATATPVNSALPAPVLPRVVAPPPASKPVLREPVKEIAKPAPATTVSYGISEDARTDELVPLAAAPPKRAPSAPKAQPVAPPPAAQTAPAVTPAAEAPIFDSLSTGEEVFGKEATTVSMEETAILKSDQKAAQAFVRSLNPASLLQSSVVPKRHTGLKVFLSLAAVVIVAAGAVYYVHQYRGNTRQGASAATPVSISQAPASNANAPIPTQTVVETPPASIPQTQPPAQTRPVAKRAPVETLAESTITVTPIHNSAKSAALGSHATISNGIANIYAGDLAARPQVTQHATVAMNAPMPSINGSPKDLAPVPSNTGIGSLVGSSSSALPAPPKPAEPKPVVQGGQVVEPRLIARVNPFYPPMAVSNHIEGDVEIEAMIDQSGKVTSTKVISGPTLLRGAAMNAVRQWKYSPATLDGKPITMQYKVTVRFRLAQ